MNKEQESALNDLIGKTKIHEKKEITIKSFKKVNQTIVVFTNRNSIALSESEVDFFIKNLKEVKAYNPEKIKEEVNNSSPDNIEVFVNGYSPTSENKQLKTHLLDVLKELKYFADEKTLKKAFSICNIANTMVNIQKAEIQLINTFKK